MSNKQGIVNSNVVDTSESLEFPNKYIKKLPTGFLEEAASFSEEELKKVIVDCEGNLYTIDKEKEADVPLQAAKAVVKDLGVSYREASSTQTAKIKYALFLLVEKGVNLDSSDKD